MDGEEYRSGSSRRGVLRGRPSSKRQELAFQPAAIEILETPASPSLRLLAAGILVLTSVGTVWSWIGHVDTHASIHGRIVPVGQVKVVEPLVTGRVAAIHAERGTHVAAGDRLVELDASEFTADRRKVEEQKQNLEISIARLNATMDYIRRGATAKAGTLGYKPISYSPGESIEGLAGADQNPGLLGGIPADDEKKRMLGLHQMMMRQSIAAFEAEQANHSAEILARTVELQEGEKTLSERRKLVTLSRRRSEIYEALEKTGFGARGQTIDAQRSEQDQVVTLIAEEGRLSGLAAEIRTLEARKFAAQQAFIDKSVTELVEANRQLSAVRQELAKAELFERASTLTAPVSGTVQQVRVHTIGEVVQAGQQLMIIVPDGMHYEVEGTLLNKDKGFVREGQDVRVKLDAFPYTRYGTLSGKVLTVSNDAVSQQSGIDDPNAGGGLLGSASGGLVFPIRISLDATTIEADGDTVPITSGMMVTAEVKTGNKRVIEYLLDPLLRMSDESLHER
ncbi:HlyD family type I secretion periplasmic adaptor subunit [Ensifer sp. ENS04]|uniref:HlyD family type I secretion periplasmic adaptor subunit n=1 Tax=Ensifer sp. ENS04 TaxID=2769281 RepID=UPI0017835C68|nr:HlyD family type I secretion periplasmic adaptor subunit [Ensifer sp. ENS04]MBD9538956.1 HlyD family type I secretion periplasmic adaptor subunit [Ensifer sp. ENS04]